MEKGIRLRYVDIAKGISIICIILGHLGVVEINRVVFTFHVPIFFLITGYFVSSKRTVGEFIKIKFRTLIVPYAITCLGIIILGTVKGWLKGDMVSELEKWIYASLYGAGDSYSEQFWIPSIGALWFLLATFWASVFLRISLEFNKYVRAAAVLVLFLLGYYSRTICWFPLSIQAGACAVLWMYVGFLAMDAEDVLINLNKETKSFALISCFLVWFFFMKDFESFWLVHCDIGRGVVDIIGSLCASVCVIWISRLIDIHMEHLSCFLSYFGRYSLLVLSVHIIELHFFPWYSLADVFVGYGMPASCELAFVIAAKIVVDLFAVFVLSKIMFVRKMFGLKD